MHLGESLEVEFNTMQPKYRRKLQILKYYTKENSLQFDQHGQELTPRTITNLGQPFNFHNSIEESFANKQQTSKWKQVQINSYNHLNTNQLNTQKRTKQNTHHSKKYYSKYQQKQSTDGSKTPDTNNVGYAFAEFKNSNKPNNILFGRLPNKLSIYTAEMTAIIRAMGWI